jgi:flagellar protein FliT
MTLSTSRTAGATLFMSTSPSVLRHYETIAGISQQMLAEARASHWDVVVDLGEQYQQAVQALRHIDPLSNQDRHARRDLLIKILDDDANIRLLVAPELSRLGMLLGNMKRQQSVLQAYCAPLLNP